MSLTQLVIGAALGYLVAQGALYCLESLVGWLRRTDVRQWARRLRAVPGSSILRGLSKYAGVAAAGVAVIALVAWTVEDYLKSKSVHGAATAAGASPAAIAFDADDSADDVAGLAPAPSSPLAAAGQVAGVDPYSDADFKVQRRPHRAGAAPSLKETLLERSEAKARADLLSEMALRVHRSQYDCETAARAEKYLQAGLDVWGFAAWQVKYFPTAGYRGATLPQCKGLKNIVDASSLSAQSAATPENHS